MDCCSVGANASGEKSRTGTVQWGIACPTDYQARCIALTQHVARKTIVMTKPMISVFISASLVNPPAKGTRFAKGQMQYDLYFSCNNWS